MGDINTLEMMERVLDAEKPDLVAYTGDNVDGVTSKDALSVSLYNHTHDQSLLLFEDKHPTQC